MAFILRPDGSKIPLNGTGDKHPTVPNVNALTLEQMQAAVGGLIEPVYHPRIGKVIVIVNEECGYLDSEARNGPARTLIAKAYNLPDDDAVVEIRGNVIVPSHDDGDNWY